ncbi:intradiol ring-cleavage dioxygenase [Bradyrhizobium sp.]|uniref:intradiol ring-cleavage dioxygenase n=1 Tax=Bradyrhizobium sp. TaxID=376 RepID=UPI002BA8595A|nr:intradiol ring-cleavage dioxygenase [Bradyrhizobium sp.]HWX58054.1 intradiol ring-cleavage dioxygenase [Bradyrhizobium sp.]
MPTSTRRGFLTLASASAAGLLQSGRAQAATDSTAASADDACILTPQSEEGPYYLDPKLVRADIAEGRPGVPLALRLRVIEAGSCTPIAGARVDIWHCDARGIYSAFPGQGDSHNIDHTGKTFLRGTQMVDGNGWGTFKTIYPGWYAGRATHIHFKVFLDERTVLTGQTFFPEALNEYIYGNVPDYTKRPQQRLVINANDRVAMESDPEHKAYCAVKEERERYVAMLTLAVDRNARVSADGLLPPPPGPPPAGAREGGRPPKAQWIKDRLAAVVPGLKRSPF